jgi:FAD binding domain
LPPAPVVAKKGFPSRGVEKPGDVNHLAQSFGFVVPAGVVSTTGIAGLTLGGGTGYLTRKYGLTIDNLLGVDMVLADGSLLGNSEHQPIANLPVAHVSPFSWRLVFMRAVSRLRLVGCSFRSNATNCDCSTGPRNPKRSAPRPAQTPGSFIR